MAIDYPFRTSDAGQLRLFIEEVCCDVCRFDHIQHGHTPDKIKILRDSYLGSPDAYADIRVEVPGEPIYFVEVKFGYPSDLLVRRLRHKYGGLKTSAAPTRLVLVVDTDARPDWHQIESAIIDDLGPAIQLEVWSEPRLSEMLQSRFGVAIGSLREEGLFGIWEAVQRAKTLDAFGNDADGGSALLSLQGTLLWHFGFWHLRELRERGRASPRDILPPGDYRRVVILLADLCSFSSYVRDTPDPALVRESLTSFYSKARYQIINHGGMMYQFVGDEVIGLFGLPEQRPGYVQSAMEAANALIDIGNSVSNRWQRSLDRVQNSVGLHIGMAMGDLQVVSMQPFGRVHMGAIGDAINLAARLTASAGSNEIIISNSLREELPESLAANFGELEPIEGRNVGRIKCWKNCPRKPIEPAGAPAQVSEPH